MVVLGSLLGSRNAIERESKSNGAHWNEKRDVAMNEDEWWRFSNDFFVPSTLLVAWPAIRSSRAD